VLKGNPQEEYMSVENDEIRISDEQQEDLKSYGLMNLVDGKTPLVGNEPEDMTMTWPHLLMQELNLFLLVMIIIMGMSVLFNAPLEEIANSSVTPNPAKAPWYFVGLQELLSWGPPFWGGIFVPTVAVIALILIPYFDRSRVGTGVWFHPSRRIHNILFTVFVVVAIGLIIVGTFMRGPNWRFYWPWQAWPAH
jgi:menaquinol-cytochrome c reductase cytochrome b/c subunit